MIIFGREHKTSTMKTLQSIGIFALLITFASCGSPKNDADIKEIQPEASLEIEYPEEWKTSENALYGFHHPDSFEVDMSGKSGLHILLLSPQTSASDIFRDNIGLLTQDLPQGGFTLDEYAKLSIEQIQSLITDATVIENKSIEVNETKYHKVVYTGKQGQYSLKWQQWFRIKDNKAYILTLTCNETEYVDYVGVGEQIMETFEIK